MPPHLRAELDRLRRRLVLTLELIREVEAERDEAAAAEPGVVRGKIAALQRIRGVGPNFAAVLAREVFYRSFDDRRQLASYVGIAPMPHQSGGVDRDRRISRAGNPRARTTTIQLAWLWLRFRGCVFGEPIVGPEAALSAASAASPYMRSGPCLVPAP